MESSSNTSSYPKALLKILLFGAILAAMLYIAGIILNPGQWFLDGKIKDRNSRYAEIMTVPKDCIDIYNVGNSLAMVGISPMDLWADEGYASFNLCKGASRTTEAYYLMRHGLKYQHPKVVLIETNMLFRSEDPISNYSNLLSEIFQYYFPFLRYHSLWQSAGADSSIREYYMGYLVSEHVMPYKGERHYLKKTDEVKKINPLSIRYMDKMIALCQKNGIEVVLYSLCSPRSYDTTRLNAVHEYVESRNVPYIDFNQNWEEIGIDWDHDTRDEGDHLNEYGVAKITAYMGGWLKENYNLPDRRNDPAYSSWNDRYLAYLETLKKMEGVSYYMLEGDTVYD